VHEIDWAVIGPPALSEKLGLGEACMYGTIALSAMQELEKVIARHAPTRFPNRLDEEGRPIYELEVLEAEINSLEDQISARLASAEECDEWATALAAQRAARKEENEFIFNATFLHPVRYLDYRGRLKAQLAKQRVEYLESLLAELIHA
jgi:hypothetical protein